MKPYELARHAGGLSPDAVRARIDELLDRWYADSHQEDYTVARRGDEWLVALSVYPLAAHAHALARAARVLDDAGLQAPTIPLARQVLECAGTAMWIEAGGMRAARVMQRELARNRLATFDEFAKSGDDEDPEVVKQWTTYVSELDSEARESGQVFKQRCDELEGSATIYAWYRALSSVSHAGGAVMELYTERVDRTPDRPIGFGISASPKPWVHDAVQGFTLTMLLYAAMAWDRMDKAHPSRSRLKQIAAELGVKLEWRLSGSGFTARERWEKEQKRASSGGTPGMTRA